MPSGGGAKWHELLPATALRPVGFTDEEALLPVTLRSFQGYRLLQEYFAFPQRYRFMDIGGLRPALRQINANELELGTAAFTTNTGGLVNGISVSAVTLNCGGAAATALVQAGGYPIVA